MESDLMDLLVLLNSDDERDLKLGVGIFNAQYYNKGIIFPPEFKQGLKPKWKNFSLEYKRTCLTTKTNKWRVFPNQYITIDTDSINEENYYIYLI